MTPPTYDFTGRKICVKWTEQAVFDGSDWEYFHVLTQNDYGMLCQGIDSPDGRHDGSKTFVFWPELVAVWPELELVADRLIDEQQAQPQPQPHNGGPAFPVTQVDLDHQGQVAKIAPSCGMTLRDYFAAAALQGMMANPSWDSTLRHTVAENAYGYANAMLAARQEAQP